MLLVRELVPEIEERQDGLFLLLFARAGLCFLLLRDVPPFVVILEDHSKPLLHIGFEKDGAWRAIDRHQMSLFRFLTGILVDSRHIIPPIRGHGVAKLEHLCRSLEQQNN